MSQLNQWFMPAPMITMDRPRVFSALRANSRATWTIWSRRTPVMPWPSAKVPSMRRKKSGGRESGSCRSGPLELFRDLRCRYGLPRRSDAALDVVQHPARPRVEPPGGGDAGEVEGEEAPQGCLRAPGEADGEAVGHG